MKYLVFKTLPRGDRAKTDRILVVSAQSGDTLGAVKWFGRWRQYTFFPATGTIFNPDCLREIADHCALLTKRHRERAK